MAACARGFPQEMLDEEMRKIAYSVQKLEARLAGSPWLAGGDYTLADICNFAIANGMQNGFAELVNAKDTPHLVAWIQRINERPACKRMFAKQPSSGPTAGAISTIGRRPRHCGRPRDALSVSAQTHDGRPA